MIYVRNMESGRTVEVSENAVIPEGWEKVDEVLCSFCGEKPFDDQYNDWFLTLVCGYRYCSQECRQKHVEKGI